MTENLGHAIRMANNPESGSVFVSLAEFDLDNLICLTDKCFDG
jgi:hypothetical protein